MTNDCNDNFAKSSKMIYCNTGPSSGSCAPERLFRWSRSPSNAWMIYDLTTSGLSLTGRNSKTRIGRPQGSWMCLGRQRMVRGRTWLEFVGHRFCKRHAKFLRIDSSANDLVNLLYCQRYSEAPVSCVLRETYSSYSKNGPCKGNSTQKKFRDSEQRLKTTER